MINVNGMELDTTYQQLLIDLKGSLMSNGIFLLNDIKPTGDNIMITCPVHKDGHERKPSCGVSIVPKYQGSKIIEPGTVHCFTCGYTASLIVLLVTALAITMAEYLGINGLRLNIIQV